MATGFANSKRRFASLWNMRYAKFKSLVQFVIYAKLLLPDSVFHALVRQLDISTNATRINSDQNSVNDWRQGSMVIELQLPNLSKQRSLATLSA